jgi:hypothetical protein
MHHRRPLIVASRLLLMIWCLLRRWLVVSGLRLISLLRRRLVLLRRRLISLLPVPSWLLIRLPVP